MKQTLYKFYGLLHSLKSPTLLFAILQTYFIPSKKTNLESLKMAANWLVYMQNSDGGYSRKYSFIGARDKSYIETTGYIIPTLINLSDYLKDDFYKQSAFKAGEWLLKIQNKDGSFSEIDTNQPLAFDTGQCLIGLNYLYITLGDKRYLESAKMASYWLASNQEYDSSWKRVSYNNQKHSYYSRVASAMLTYADITNDSYIEKSALKHIEWVLSQQKENGFFKKTSFVEGVAPFLHTIVYVVEGLLDSYEITKDQKVLNAVIKMSEQFKTISLERDKVLCSQYDEEYRCKNSEKCVTGIAQWAGIALRLGDILDDNEYRKSAINALKYLKEKQLQSSKMRGGFSASIPFWGRYGAFDFVNWSNKFFIDSMLLLDKQNKL